MQKGQTGIIKLKHQWNRHPILIETHGYIYRLLIGQHETIEEEAWMGVLHSAGRNTQPKKEQTEIGATRNRTVIVVSRGGGGGGGGCWQQRAVALGVS